jgi:toxin ParE1/3/4
MSMARTKSTPIFESEPDAAEEARLDAEALAAYKAGRVVPHAKVVEWLKSWGTSNVLPRPKSKPRWTRSSGPTRALANLEAIRIYIEQFNPRAARLLADSLVTAGNSLALFPQRGRRVPGTDMRELVIADPYIIRYQVVGDVVVILRVRHSARRPTNPWWCGHAA